MRDEDREIISWTGADSIVDIFFREIFGRLFRRTNAGAFLVGRKISVSTTMPCSRLSMPMAARLPEKPTAQRCPVIFNPLACAWFNGGLQLLGLDAHVGLETR